MTSSCDLRWAKLFFAPAMLAAFSLASAALAESVTGTAAADIAVDVRGDVCRGVSPAAIGYSPKWGGVTNAGAYVVIEKVEHPDAVNASTTVLATLAANAEGEVPYTVDVSGSACVRLIHRVYSAAGSQIGEPLVRDVSFGTLSEAQATTVADTRAGSLREAASIAARTATPIDLTYSTLWATNGIPAAVTLKARRLNGEGGTVTGETSFFSAEAEAEGLTPMRGVASGWMRLVCQVTDEQDALLLEYVTDDFLLRDPATVIFIQ